MGGGGEAGLLPSWPVGVGEVLGPLLPVIRITDKSENITLCRTTYVVCNKVDFTFLSNISVNLICVLHGWCIFEVYWHSCVATIDTFRQ